MCYTHGKLVDSDTPRFTVELLRQWKKDAEDDCRKRLGKASPPQNLPNLEANMAVSLSPDGADTRVLLTVDVTNAGQMPSVVRNWQFEYSSGDDPGGVILCMPLYNMDDKKEVTSEVIADEKAIGPGDLRQYQHNLRLPYSMDRIRERGLRIEVVFFDVLHQPTFVGDDILAAF
jgi:hypothetical protein